MAINLNGTTGITTTGLTSNGIDDNATSTAMTLDSSGNVGIGVVPSAWNTFTASLQIDGTSLSGLGANNTALASNAYYDSAWKYYGTGSASLYQQNAGLHRWDIAGSGTAGTAISFSEAMRIDSSGNLLVGKTSESGGTAGHFFSSTGYQRSTRNGGIQILNRISTDGSIIDFQRDGSAVGSIRSRAGVVSTLILDPRTSVGTGVGITGSSQNAILPTDAGGNLEDAAIDFGDGSTRFKDLYLSGGVYLGGTGAANKLDDYEEGTWTPVIRGGTTDGTTSYSARLGWYTKIGRQVIVSINCAFTTSGGSGSLEVAGLPFTSASSQEAVGTFQANSMELSYQSNVAQYNSVLQSNVSYFHFRGTKSNGGSHDTLQIQNINYLRATIAYITN